MEKAKSWKSDDHGPITPTLSVRGCAEAIEFWKRAFGAEERSRAPGPGGQIMHAELKVFGTVLMLNDEMPEMGCRSPQALGGTPIGLYCYVPDVDAVFARAVAAGCTPVMPVSDMFWGDRFGKVVDPYGFEWGLATHTTDLTPDEVAAAQREFMARMEAGDCGPQA